MITSSAFDILGPVMVGPSSSHTAGALRLARFALSLLKAPVKHAAFTLYNSFSQTYQGHGTDRALLGGILGFSPADPRVAKSPEFAKESGITWEFIPAGDNASLHPNTIDITLTAVNDVSVSIRGESVGGGRIHVSSIDGITVNIDGKLPTLIVVHYDIPGMLALMTQALGNAQVNIAFMSSYRTEPGQLAYAVFETDSLVPEFVINKIEHIEHVLGVHSVQLEGTNIRTPSNTSAYDFDTAQDLLDLCETYKVSIGEIIARREHELFGPVTDTRIAEVLDVMRKEVHEPLETPLRSLGGFIGGEARRFSDWQQSNNALGGTMLAKACTYALAVLERSATMGVIVAAPTAGSSGVVPGSLLSCAEELNLSDEVLTEGLYTAAGIGMLCERWASISGAEGGCQAEVGTASAMAAAALATMMGEDAKTSFCAAEITIANMLGLVCDPVQGLVEIPCQIRNAAGVANAFTACDLARANISLPIPFDEILSTMAQVGKAMPSTLRETAQGGLATCPSVCKGCLLGV